MVNLTAKKKSLAEVKKKIDKLETVDERGDGCIGIQEMANQISQRESILNNEIEQAKKLENARSTKRLEELIPYLT